MPTRYKNRQVVRNTNELYESFIEERDLKVIRHYRTPIISNPTTKQRRQLRNTRVVWKQGDRFWKLSSQFYGSPDYWWVIAWYNQKPTEAHVRIGTTLVIPQPLDKVLEMAGY